MGKVSTNTWIRAICMSIPFLNILVGMVLGIYYLGGFIRAGHYLSAVIGLVFAAAWIVVWALSLDHFSTLSMVFAVMVSFAFVYWADGVMEKNATKAADLLAGVSKDLNIDFSFGWIIKVGVDIKGKKIAFADKKATKVIDISDVRSYEMKFHEHSRNGRLSYNNVFIIFHIRDVRWPMIEVQLKSKEEADFVMSQLGIAFES